MKMTTVPELAMLDINDRVVSHRIDFGFHDATGLQKRIQHRPHYLWDTAQRVDFLHLFINTIGLFCNAVPVLERFPSFRHL